ncbi:MAG: ferredoxin [Elusimicrobia bacterium RIFOXYA2_FULL_40_6]|nr:MAG: ferredoxin [Elusimicrobia bacterium RIFOXYA2_FULL_40_6]
MAAKVDIEKCNGCGKCVDICMLKAVKIQNGKAVISDDCVDCGVCLNECTEKALSIERNYREL